MSIVLFWKIVLFIQNKNSNLTLLFFFSHRSWELGNLNSWIRYIIILSMKHLFFRLMLTILSFWCCWHSLVLQQVWSMFHWLRKRPLVNNIRLFPFFGKLLLILDFFWARLSVLTVPGLAQSVECLTAEREVAGLRGPD